MADVTRVVDIVSDEAESAIVVTRNGAVRTEKSRRRIGLAIVTATAGLGILVASEMYVAGGADLRGAGLAASYLSGMTMLVLPCTLPMVLIMVPLVLARELRQGVLVALGFGAGITVTLAVYGALVAELGSSIGVTTTTKAMWLMGGAAAWMFGCSQLGLLKIRVPNFGVRLGGRVFSKPGVIQAFLLGLLLGNAGLGCPCPPWYLLLTGVATSGSPAYGAAIGLAQGLGRVTPILAIAVAAMLGLDATSAIVRKRQAVERSTGATLVVLGAGIVVFMALAHPWWEATVVHAGWNHFLAFLGGPQLSEIDAGGGPLPAGLWWAPWAFAGLAIVPMSLFALRRHQWGERRRVGGLLEDRAI